MSYVMAVYALKMQNEDAFPRRAYASWLKNLKFKSPTPKASAETLAGTGVERSLAFLAFPR